MAHIEFFGPPGAGKSTLHTHLIRSPEFYGGVKDNAVQRAFPKHVDAKRHLLYRFLPSTLRHILDEEFLQYRLGRIVLEEYLRDYPGFVNMLSEATNSVANEPEKVFLIGQHFAERYQLAKSTCKKDENLCLDESLVQGAFSILWRDPTEDFQLKTYFDHVPLPDIVIHIDAPSDVCIKRQQQRGRVTVSKEWTVDDIHKSQQRTREICSEISDFLSRECHVINIENVGTVKKSAHEIEEYINLYES